MVVDYRQIPLAAIDEYLHINKDMNDCNGCVT